MTAADRPRLIWHVALAAAFLTPAVGCGQQPKEKPRPDAPPLTGGTEWLNASGPLSIKKDLKGKIVLLDFWTLCCINCIHVLPDLAKLEKEFEKELVVIGVHSPKFDNEKNSKSIREAILRYEISHPVINDANRAIWTRYGVNSWPSLYLIDPEGKVVGYVSGEGNYDLLRGVIKRLIKEHKAKGTLKPKKERFDLLRYKKTKTPLFYPGKLLADAASGRLFIADSTHHRLVVTDLKGKLKYTVGGGTPDFKNGTFAEARFDDPQGLALDAQKDTLYVADRKNHAIRKVDLKEKTVTTIAGTGTQDRSRSGGDDPLKTGLNSPWALLLKGSELYIAMAGDHQLWKFDLAAGEIGPYAGAGPENIRDGALQRTAGVPFDEVSLFAQPSGLTSDGKFLYVADSEVSAIRKVPLGGKGRVTTLVGEGLFEFGDKDGTGDEVRLQHALGVAFYGGKIIVADTYNDKLKKLDPKTRKCETYLSGEGLFSEPAGLSVAGDKLYVADTNAHRIRVVDLKTDKVTTLELQGVEPPKAN